MFQGCSASPFLAAINPVQTSARTSCFRSRIQAVQPAFMALPLTSPGCSKVLRHQILRGLRCRVPGLPPGSPPACNAATHLTPRAHIPGAGVHRHHRFSGPNQDVLLPIFDAAGIVVGDALLGGLVPVNRLTDETRRADCHPAPPPAGHGGRRIAASTIGDAT